MTKSVENSSTESKHNDAKSSLGLPSDLASMPVDRGWAWMILIGATLQIFLSIGTLKCNGILFVIFQERFQSNATLTSLIPTVYTAVFCILTPIVMTVGMKVMSSRQSLFIGASITTLAFIVTTFAGSINVLILSHGAILGLGAAFAQTPAFAMVGIYFHKRRALATCIAASGGGLGGLVLAPLFTYLFGHYGYFGAMLIMVSLNMNGFVVGALLRPPAFYSKTKKRTFLKQVSIMKKRSLSTKSKQCLEEQDTASRSESTELCDKDHVRETQLEKASLCEYMSTKDADLTTPSTQFDNYRGTLITAFEYQNKPESKTNTCIVDQSKIENEADSHMREERAFSKITKMLDVRLFKNPVFLILLFGQAIHSSTGDVHKIFIAPLARDEGLTHETIATLVLMMAGIEALSRPVLGAVADRIKTDKVFIVVGASIILGIAGQFITFYTNLATIAVFCVIIGLFGSLFLPLMTGILVDYFGREMFQGAMGFCVLFYGMAMSSLYAAIGGARDKSGSYVVPFRILGGLNLVSAVILGTASGIYSYKKSQTTASEILEQSEVNNLASKI